MQDQAEIARAFGAWQRAHQKLCEAETRLAAAEQAHQQGRGARPDVLRKEVLSLKAEQEWRYDEAAASLHRKNTPADVHKPSPAPGRLPDGSPVQPA